MIKLPKELENPLDIILYNIADKVSPFFYKLKFTPNIITTLSNILCIISIFFIYKKNYKLAGIFYFISYFFDCLDGFYARKYKMTSEFGRIYDNISDIIKISIILMIIIVNIRKSKIKISILCIAILLVYLNTACVGKYLNTTYILVDNNMCNIIDNKKAEKGLEYSKYFGHGTFNLILAILLGTI